MLALPVGVVLMLLKYRPIVVLVSVLLGSTAASASQLTVSSYDMNNGNGTTQFTFGYNYFDFQYRDNSTGLIDPNANQNGSTQPIPNNAAPKDAPLSGGKGLLTNGVIATQVYSLVTTTNPTTGPTAGLIASGPFAGQQTQYVGWKYQDPTIVFHLASGQQNVSSINLYVAANNPAIGDLNGLVAAPKNVVLDVNGNPVSVTMTTTAINAFTSEITLNGFGSISSSSLFSLTLDRGSLQQDGIDYYNQHVLGFDPTHPNDSSHCTGFCDPDSGPFASGFRTEAAGGQTGPLLNAGLEPWIMVSEVQFFSAAVPEISTWLMMVLGFLTLGVIARKGRRLQVRPLVP
jgi:hypothetical protein